MHVSLSFGIGNGTAYASRKIALVLISLSYKQNRCETAQHKNVVCLSSIVDVKRLVVSLQGAACPVDRWHQRIGERLCKRLGQKRNISSIKESLHSPLRLDKGYVFDRVKKKEIQLSFTFCSPYQVDEVLVNSQLWPK